MSDMSSWILPSRVSPGSFVLYCNFAEIKIFRTIKIIEEMWMEAQIGKAIHQYRKERQMTLEKLGELANLSAGHLSQIERGLAAPSLNALRGIADAFGIPLSHLLLTQDRGIVNCHYHILVHTMEPMAWGRRWKKSG